MDNIKFVSIETDSHNNVERKLLHSCLVNGIDIDIKGKGLEWQGFLTKFNVVIEYLQNIDTDLVCFTDSRDVLYMSDSETIYNRFIDRFGIDKIVYNGETNCFPDSSLAELHPEQEKKYKYLNSGCVIGNRELLINILESALEIFNTEFTHEDLSEGYGYGDQYLVQRVFLSKEYGNNFTLDYNCDIFQCVWDEEHGRSNNFDLIYMKDRIYNRLTDTFPLIFHFPGPTTTDSQVWKILNNEYYNVTNKGFFE